MFVKMSHVASVWTLTNFLVGTIASLVTKFVSCLDSAPPPRSNVVINVCPLLKFVMGGLTVQMLRMRKIVRKEMGHGCVREPFSQDHSHACRVKEIRKIS